MEQGYYWLQIPYTRRDTGERMPGAWELVIVGKDRWGKPVARGFTWNAQRIDKFPADCEWRRVIGAADSPPI